MMVSPTSLRGRLVLGALLVGIAFALIFGAGATWRLHQLEDKAVRSALQTRLDLARDEVAPDGTLVHDLASPKSDLVQIIGADGKVRSASPGLLHVGPLADLSAVRGQPAGYRTRRTLNKPDVDLATMSVPLVLPGTTAGPAGTGALVVAVDAEGFTSATADLLLLLIVGLISVVIAIVLLSWWLTGRALKSVTRLTEEAEKVGAMELTEGLPVPAGDAELARLVGALNRMLVRLHESHGKELAFASDAGHRLRTPIATLRAEAELALRENNPAEQMLAIRRIMLDADQLTVIVDRMLARGRSQGEPVVPVREAIETAAAAGARRGEISEVSVTVSVDDAIGIDVECEGLIDIVEPLVDNAVQHSPPGGEVTLTVRPGRRDGPDSLDVEVSDQGPGVGPALAPHIFDAWVSSRDASIAGGLGLWLAREKARDLGGEVSLVDGNPGRTTFRVTLPAAPGGNQARGRSESL